MKVNLCECGILKSENSEVCCVCNDMQTFEVKISRIKEVKAQIKAATKAAIKRKNASSKKQ